MAPPDAAAPIFLLLLAAALVAWAVAEIVRSPYGTVDSVLYFVNVLLTRLLWRAKVEGKLELPPGGGAVFVCNHRSSADPCFVQLIADRRVYWMVAREFAEHPNYAWLMRKLPVIPTRRGGADTAAIRMAIRLAREGNLVGVLPEGRINMSEELMLAVRPGAALIALRARVPIVPCYIEGSPYDGFPFSPLWMSAQVRLVVGRPIDLSSYYGREREPGVTRQITLDAMREVARLAGRADFVPQSAGRRWKPTREEVAAAMAESAHRKG